MGLNPRELSFEFKPNFIPNKISQFLGEASRIGNVSDGILKLDDYVNRLEDEMRKIAAFQRELPLCMLLINDAITALKQEAIKFRRQNVEPILEEFIPLKKSCDEIEKADIKNKDKDSGDKRNWLSSTQLWKTDDDLSDTKPNQNQNPVLETKKRADEVKPAVIDCLNELYTPSGRAFMPFKACSSFPAIGKTMEDKEELPVSSGLSLLTPRIKNQKEELKLKPGGLLSCKINSNRPFLCPSPPNVQSSLITVTQPMQQQHNSRKQRRCWSPELHRRFVNALHQLGGSQVATPKQIRELMQVDGLTNDEVKSHLQKYRLHTRKVPNSITGRAIWMSHDQCGESSKQSNGSPEGPLQLNTATGGISTIGDDSMEDVDDDEDEDETSARWKSHSHATSGNDDV